jgi:quinol monooxygenase YgiN
MDNQRVRVVAHITAQPDRAAEVKALLLRLITPTRAEAGCLSYELHQSETDPADFVFIEEWRSGAAIAAHMQSPHVQEAFSKVPPLLAAPPDIRRYHKIA